MAARPRRVPPGNLVLICDGCDAAVVADFGFLTVRDRKFLFYHDKCAKVRGVGWASVERTKSGRPWMIRVSRIATAELMLATLSALAVEIRDLDWGQMLYKITADTQWYFDKAGEVDAINGEKPLLQHARENRAMYEKADLHIDNRPLFGRTREEILSEADRLEAEAKTELEKVMQ